MNIYYVYQYVREDGTPYYIGKGKKGRAYSKNHAINLPKNDSRILILKENLSESAAHELEIYLISKYGRKDINTGILRNKTDGGEGVSGYVVSEETKYKISKARKGIAGKPKTKEQKQKLSKSMTGKTPWNKGKIGAQKHSNETKYKISMLQKGKKLGSYGIVTCPARRKKFYDKIPF
jgi:hypothetical protein